MTILRLTDKEASLIRSALAEYVKSVSEKARRICGSYSEEAIALCCHRLEVDNLLAEIDSGRRLLTVDSGRERVTSTRGALRTSDATSIASAVRTARCQ